MMTDWLLDADAPTARLPIYASPFARSSSGGRSDEDDDDSDDDDSDDDDDDDDDDSDDDDDEDDLAGMTDAELRDELKKTRGELSKASGSSKVKRDRIKSLRRELEEERRKPKAKAAEKTDDKGGAEPIDVEAIKAEARREEREASYTRIKRTEAKSAFVAKGAAPDVAADLLGFLKLDEIDVDDDGEIDADSLAEEIDRVQQKYPALFSRGRKRRESVAGDGDRGNEKPRTKTMTASEKQAALLTGGSRR